MKKENKKTHTSKVLIAVLIVLGISLAAPVIAADGSQPGVPSAEPSKALVGLGLFH